MTPTESMARRLALALNSIEQEWRGMVIGIAYDIDTDTGRVRLDFVPEGNPAQTVTVFADVRDVRVGAGDHN
jgi:hypothetical protein